MPCSAGTDHEASGSIPSVSRWFNVVTRRQISVKRGAALARVPAGQVDDEVGSGVRQEAHAPVDRQLDHSEVGGGYLTGPVVHVRYEQAGATWIDGDVAVSVGRRRRHVERDRARTRRHAADLDSRLDHWCETRDAG